jgi:hypothetical protein
VLGWFGSGQSLTALPDFIAGSAGVISGYSEAMAYPVRGQQWQLWAALAAVAIVAAHEPRHGLSRR